MTTPPAYSFVTVSFNVATADGSPVPALGDMFLQVSDFVWDTTTGNLVVVPPIELGNAGGGYIGNGMQLPLLAQDNSTLSTNWSWLFSATLPGVGNLPTRVLTVKTANGPTQPLTALLAASTIYTPPA